MSDALDLIGELRGAGADLDRLLMFGDSLLICSRPIRDSSFVAIDGDADPPVGPGSDRSTPPDVGNEAGEGPAR